MKFYQILIFLAMGALFAYLIQSQCSEPQVVDHKDEINALERTTDALKAKLKVVENERDSLMKIPPQIEYKYVKKVAEIDSLIKKDSTYAITEFRSALQANNELPDKTETPSFKELGLSAKIMFKVPKLELQIQTYKEITLKDLQVQENLTSQITSLKQISKLQKETIESQQVELDKAYSFWRSRELWFGLGVVGTIAVVWASGKLK